MLQENFEYCPDCIKFTKKDEILISYYDLQEDKSYKGGIGLYNINKKDSKIEEKDFQSSTGIFDFYLFEKEKIVSANVDKSFSYLEIKNNKIENKENFKVEEGKPLYIDMEDKKIYSGMEGGYISIFDLENFKETYYSEKIHQDNVWIVKKVPKKNLLLTGSDDTYLQIYDLNEKEVIQKKKPFYGDYESGVTAIEFDKENDNLFYTGCFNSQIKIFDLRQIQIPVLTKNLDFKGGIWRIIEKNGLIGLALSYSNKYQILDKKNMETIFTSGDEHKSLLYGMDFFKDGDYCDIVSVSFYDKKLVHRELKI